MSVEPLLQPTCYICLEECNTTSPCECKAPVHHKCLWQYNRKSSANKCTICQGEFQQVFNQCLIIMGGILSILFLCIFYIVGGVLGEFVWSVTGMCVCAHIAQSRLDVIFSQTFAVSSLSMVAMVGVCISGVLCVRRSW